MAVYLAADVPVPIAAPHSNVYNREIAVVRLGIFVIETILSESNYYHVLGLTELASEDEIKAAYRNRVKQVHPDRFADRDRKKKAQEAFLKVNKAFETLKDPLLRQDYERQLQFTATGGRQTEVDKHKQAEEQFLQAQEQERQGQLDEAIRNYQEAIRNHKTMAHYHSYLGCALQKKGWEGYAQSEFKTALTLNAADAIALKFYRPIVTNQNAIKPSFAQKFLQVFSNKSKLPRIGDILVEQGHLTKNQLTQALQNQRSGELLLGEILLQLNYLTPKQLADALILQADLLSKINK